MSQPLDINKGKCDYCFQSTSIGRDMKWYADPSRQSSLRFFRKLDCPGKVQADSSQKRIAKVIEMYDEWSASTEAICVTKPCSNCNAAVEKKQGFNHVKCMRCGIDFCWICCKRINSFSTTSHTCSKFDPNNEKSWNFFMQRFKAQDLSEVFAWNQLDELREADSDMRLGENFVMYAGVCPCTDTRSTVFKRVVHTNVPPLGGCAALRRLRRLHVFDWQTSAFFSYSSTLLYDHVNCMRLCIA